MRVSYSPFVLILSAFLTRLAQQPLHLGWLSWFSLIPFLFILNRIESLKDFIKVGLQKFGHIDAAVHCSYPRSPQWGTRFEDLQPEWLKEDLFNQLGGAILFSQKIITMNELITIIIVVILLLSFFLLNINIRLKIWVLL